MAKTDPVAPLRGRGLKHAYAFQIVRHYASLPYGGVD